MLLCAVACERRVAPSVDAGTSPSAPPSVTLPRGSEPVRTGARDEPSGQPASNPSARNSDVPAAETGDPSRPSPERAVASLAATGRPRVYIKNRFVFVRPRPDVNADWLGFLWFGSSVELRGEPIAVRGPGCATFYAIEPMGFVCVDQKQATLSADDAVFQAVSALAPRLSQAAPHRYAESLGVELHSEVNGAPPGWPTLPQLPPFFHEPRRRLLPLSTLAYVEEQQTQGQSYLLSADLLWVKKEQVTLYPEITFHGVELGGAWQLPLAFFRQAGAHKFRRGESGTLARSDAVFALHEVVSLGDQVAIQHGERYFQVAGGEDWLRERDAVLPVPRSQTPWGARVGKEDRSGRGPKDPRQTWIEVSVLGGWLLAFEGTRPVFATLISGGRGGIPQEGKNTLEISATPVGTFPISGKLATVTLEAPGEYVHSDVPWVQNFQKPYAIHTAYWHDNWGNLASGGCINVSPIDGKWLFDFSEPKLPRGWHAVRWQPNTGAPTLLVVHE